MSGFELSQQPTQNVPSSFSFGPKILVWGNDDEILELNLSDIAPPQEWLDLGLNYTYDELDPNGAVAFNAIESHTEFETAHEAKNNLYGYGVAPSKYDIEEADERIKEARAKTDLFHSIYTCIINLKPSDEDKIDVTCNRKIADTCRRPSYSVDLKMDLIDFIEDLRKAYKGDAKVSQQRQK